MTKPNVLFIMCDQMRWDALPCNGNPIVETPNIDRLAAAGVNFSNSFTPDPICVPARACLTTGSYPHKCTGTKENKGAVQDGYPLLGEEMEKRGYDTYAIGKLHYNPYTPPGEPRTTHGLKTVELAESGRVLGKFDPRGQLQGLEDYHDYLHTVGWGGYTRGHGLGNNDVYAAASPIPAEHYVDTWVADRSIDYLTQHLRDKADKPFFLWASFPKPHSAFDPPRPYDTRYDPRTLPLPVGEPEAMKERGLDRFAGNQYKYMWDLLSPEAKKVIKAHYYGLITHQDVQVGKLIDFLQANGLFEQTIIVYTSDHGEMLGDFGLYFKQNFYNGSVRVPLMISYPDKLPQGELSDELVGLQDLLPTLLALTGDPLEREADGQDLTPFLLGEGEGGVREYYISQCNDDPNQQYMVCGKRWKYIYHQLGGVEELYDQERDRSELHNLAADPDPDVQAVRERMKHYLIDWCVENGDASMIEGGGLRRSERPLAAAQERVNPFGRRWY